MGIRKNKNIILGCLAVLLLQIFISILLSQIYSISQNTIENNKNWISFRERRDGSYSFNRQLETLGGNKLNLFVSRTFYNVLYAKPVNANSIEFDFKLSREAYFYFIFNKNEIEFSALRVSNNKLFPNAILRVKVDGEYIHKEPIKLKNIKKTRWNHCKVVFCDNVVSIFMNDALEMKTFMNINKKQYFGFMGSSYKVSIDNIFVERSDDYLKIYENFESKINIGINCFKIYPFVFICTILLLSVLYFIYPHNYKIITFQIIMIKMIFSLMLISIIIAQLYFLPYRYFSSNNIFARIGYKAVCLLGYYLGDEELDLTIVNPKNKKEIHVSQEENLGMNKDLEGWECLEEEKYRLKEIEREYKEIKYKYDKKIFFIGTSQTWGEGTRFSQECFVKLVEKYLNSWAKRDTYYCINGGIRNSDSSCLLKVYSEKWSKYEWDYIVINLSNNDAEKGVSERLFYKNLVSFIEVSEKKGIETIFILEPNAREYAPGGLYLHKVVKKIGSQYDKIVIDLNQFLTDNYDLGILWWDYVHMTPFGHKIAAEYIFNELKELLKKRDIVT
ncbi:MAG: hypothetical protein DRP84_02120 [Spirochaetes bacterium]|nr:MAG: hypothetical protein DRP84_02120 [Spirochaetota bacterium]